MEPKKPKEKNIKRDKGKFTKGSCNPNPNGRGLNSLNKTTTAIKWAFAQFVENNIENLQEWLERTAIEDPKGAIEVVIKVAPYVLPKLRQSEVTIETKRREIDYSKFTDEELAILKRILD